MSAPRTVPRGTPRLPPSCVHASRVHGDRVPDGCPLSPREYAAIVAVARGESAKEIAARTNRNLSAVRSALCKAYARLGVLNAPEAVAACYDGGWLTPEPNGKRKLEVTPREQVYLHALDLHLRSRTAEEQQATRQIMERARDDAGMPAGSNMRRRKLDNLFAFLHSTSDRKAEP